MFKKVRVLHVYNIMNIGGAETFIMNVFRKIDRNKIEFNFLCLGDGVGKYDAEILNLGGKIFHIEKFNKNNFFNSYIKIKKFINESGPYDVIHLPIQSYSGIFCFAAYKLGIKKIIVHSHSASDKTNCSIFRKTYIMFMRFLINKYSTIKLSCGKAAGIFLFGIKEKFEIIYNGIDIEKFKNVNENAKKKLKNKYNLNSELIIGHVGRFSKVKNHEFFIILAKKLIERKIKFKIMLVGDGEEYVDFTNKLHEFNLEDYFILTGLQKNTELFYSIFDVFVMPSIYEGFPVSIIEAISSGKKCVTSNTISKEVSIIPNSCVFLDLNDDLDKWVDAIVTQASQKIDKKMIDRLDDSDFSISKTVKKLEQIYLD